MISVNAVSPQRVSWVDLAKGVGIILIVLGHANRSIDRTAGLDWTASLGALDTFLYSFHVPLFFILAGVSAALARRWWQNGLRSVVLGVAVPYLLWSLIWIASKALLPGTLVNAPLDFSALWQILWMPVDHFWFLFHLIFIRLIWLLAETLFSRAQQLGVLVVLVISSLGLGLMGEEWRPIGHFVDNTVFFGSGFLLLRPLIERTSNTR